MAISGTAAQEIAAQALLPSAPRRARKHQEGGNASGGTRNRRADDLTRMSAPQASAVEQDRAAQPRAVFTPPRTMVTQPMDAAMQPLDGGGMPQGQPRLANGFNAWAQPGPTGEQSCAAEGSAHLRDGGPL